MSSRPAAGSPSAPVATNAAVAAPPAAAATDAREPAGTLLIDGELEAARDAPVGGQAVLEGVMMRGVSHWAVAVRKPSEEQLAHGGDAA